MLKKRLNKISDFMNLGEVKYGPVFNSEDFEVIIQTAYRGGPRRIALCTSERDAQAVVAALSLAIEQKAIV